MLIMIRSNNDLLYLNLQQFTLESGNKDLRLFQKTSGDFKSELIDFY